MGDFLSNLKSIWVDITNEEFQNLGQGYNLMTNSLLSPPYRSRHDRKLPCDIWVVNPLLSKVESYLSEGVVEL